MARKRMINPTIWEDPAFNKLSVKARLAFIGLISNADDDGYLRGDYRSLRRLIYGFEEKDDEQWLSELRTFKNLHFYDIDGEMFVHLLKWDTHQLQQRDRRQPSIYPECSICLASAEQMLPQVSKLSKEKKVSKEASGALKKLREQWGTPNYKK